MQSPYTAGLDRSLHASGRSKGCKRIAAIIATPLASLSAVSSHQTYTPIAHLRYPGQGLTVSQLSSIARRFGSVHHDHAYSLHLESWIEVSSQPSSSSLSSAADEIITTGLRVGHGSSPRRRRRLRRSEVRSLHISHQNTSGTSSQDEYEESESESDRIMTSSNEAVQPSPLCEQRWPSTDQPVSSASSDHAFAVGEQEETDEDATAIGVPTTEPRFTPQPNAFTHPPFQPAGRPQQPSTNPYVGTQRPSQPLNQRYSYSSQSQPTTYNTVSPSYQADHDAALRASLSTLLSFAPAARGRPKPTSSAEMQRQPAISNRVDTTTLRMVPESLLLGTSEPSAEKPLSSSARDQDDTLVANIRDNTGMSSTNDKGKRKAAATAPGSGVRSTSKDRRASKKARRASSIGPATMEEISPTLFTWAVSAGIVVLVSAISFSAGYVYGKEIGRAEAGGLGDFRSGIRDAGRCGRDMILEHGGNGLKRLRWTTGAASGIHA